MRLWLKLVLVSAVIFGMGVWILVRAPEAAPLQEGTSAEFWRFACGVGLGQTRSPGFGGKFYLPRDDWFIYGIQGMHGEYLFRVKRSVAMADFAAVVEALEGQERHDPRSHIHEGLEAWEQARAGRDDAQTLLAEIRKAKLKRLQREDPELYRYVLAKETEFQRRWYRAKRYWLTVLFEFVFVAGLIVFAAIPWLRNAGRVGWSIHLALLPVLFFLPWYLGYVPLVFTSAYPSGGIIYPSLIFPFRGLPWTKLDSAIMEHTPKILEPLWQPLGPPAALTGMGAVGPVAAVCMGLAIASVTFGIGTLLRRKRTQTTDT